MLTTINTYNPSTSRRRNRERRPMGRIQ